MEVCGIDVFRSARNNGFEIDTRKETYGRWNYFALVLIVPVTFLGVIDIRHCALVFPVLIFESSDH
jgi:hypothetical protein